MWRDFKVWKAGLSWNSQTGTTDQFDEANEGGKFVKNILF